MLLSENQICGLLSGGNIRKSVIVPEMLEFHAGWHALDRPGLTGCLRSRAET